MIIGYNMIVDRRDNVQYLAVSKSYSDNCTCSLMMMHERTIVYLGLSVNLHVHTTNNSTYSTRSK